MTDVAHGRAGGPSQDRKYNGFQWTCSLCDSEIDILEMPFQRTEDTNFCTDVDRAKGYGFEVWVLAFYYIHLSYLYFLL